jgi:hypothetical protein
MSAFVIPFMGVVVGFTAGLPLWRSGGAVSPSSVAAWLWLIGGFISFVGGVLLFAQSRWIATLYVFAGFVLLFTAALYLPEARRAYDERQGRHRFHLPNEADAPNAEMAPRFRTEYGRSGFGDLQHWAS